MFDRLLMEINQASLSWETILRKRDGFRHAYDDFDVDRVADYGDGDRARLLADAGIIRNRLNVDAAIHNAGVIRGPRSSHGGFAQWHDAHALADRRPRDTAQLFRLFCRTCKVSGGGITGGFLSGPDLPPRPHRPDSA